MIVLVPVDPQRALAPGSLGTPPLLYKGHHLSGTCHQNPTRIGVAASTSPRTEEPKISSSEWTAFLRSLALPPTPSRLERGVRLHGSPTRFRFIGCR